MSPTLELAFSPRPPRWGLRGDPHLWEALRRRVAGLPVPRERPDTTAVLFHAIHEIVGTDLRTVAEPVRVPAFETGSGMSDGHVDPAFWRDTGVPLLASRAHELARG